MTKLFYPIPTLCLFLALAFTANAQNPYAPLGIETKVLTLTEGKYPEFFPNKEFTAIGGVMLNTKTGEVVEFLEPDTVTYSFDPTVSTRFLSVDPIARQFPELTPYQFASNRPIDGIDLDGLEYDDSKLVFTVDHDKSKIKVEGEVNVKIKIINLSSSIPKKEFMDFHDRKSSKTFDNYNAITFDSHVPFDPETGEVLSKKFSVTGDLDFNFEFISVESSLDAIEKGDVVLILADKLSGSEEHAGTADKAGHAYILEVDVFNDRNHVDTHEKGHLIGDLIDVKGEKARKGFLMSYADDGTGYRLRLVEKQNIIEQTIYRKGLEKKTGETQRDTRADAEDLIRDNVEK